MNCCNGMQVVGNGVTPIVDTWWQTETGSHLITPLPYAIDLKPGSATLPFFGVEPAILNDKASSYWKQSIICAKLLEIEKKTFTLSINVRSVMSSHISFWGPFGMIQLFLTRSELLCVTQIWQGLWGFYFCRNFAVASLFLTIHYCHISYEMGIYHCEAQARKAINVSGFSSIDFASTDYLERFKICEHID